MLTIIKKEMTENFNGSNTSDLLSIKTICGPMCAGKSAKVIEIAVMFFNSGTNCVCLKPVIDRRSKNNTLNEGLIVSRGNTSTFKATELNTNFTKEESKKIIEKYDAFIFDETQFFELESIKNFIEVAEGTGKKIQLVFAGLDMDFRGEKFETIRFVSEISKDVTVLHADCSIKGCKNKATHSSKINGDQKKQVEIGGDDMYKPTCEKHFQEILDGANLEFEKRSTLIR